MSATTVMTKPRQPDIVYQPDYQAYKRRTQRRLETETLSKELPPAFPNKLESPIVWKGSDFRHEDEWTLKLGIEDIAEIRQGVAHFKGLDLPMGHICQDTFPLAALGKQLRKCSAELHQGKGFFVVRGFPVETLSREDCVIAFAGISSYVGSLRGWQDQRATALVHVSDMSAIQAVGTATYTNEKQVFHTDNGDIVSLLALEVAAEGGQSMIASSWEVYNMLVQERPDLIKTMSEDWPCDSFGGNPAYYNRPLLYFTPEQRLIIQYFRRLFTGFGSLPRPDTIPPITEAQAEALDALQFYSEKCSKSLEFRKGDIQYINNLSIFHAREGFTNNEEKSRHLLRLWLRDEEFGWQIPQKLQSGHGRTWDSLHYEKTSSQQRFPLVPEVKNEK